MITTTSFMRGKTLAALCLGLLALLLTNPAMGHAAHAHGDAQISAQTLAEDALAAR